MKKHLAIILMLMLTLAGCGGNVPEDSVAEAYFAGDKTPEQVAQIIENRVMIYLSEQLAK